MISFKKYYGLFLEEFGEQIFPHQIPARDLGLTNDISKLPTRRPYGFWMNKHGNFIEVPDMSHEPVAIKILKIMDKLNAKLPQSSSYYGIMFLMGWVRVVTECDGVTLYYELGKGMELSNAQKRNLETMMHVYRLKYMEQDYDMDS